MKFVSLVLFLSILASGCTRPLLKEGASPSVDVIFKNLSTGYVQNFYFKDNATCREPDLIGYSIHPGQSRTHSIPADKLITLATSAWRLPADPDKVAWCNPIFFSTKLRSGHSYEAVFIVNIEKKVCGIDIHSTDGDRSNKPRIMLRKGSGPFGSGVMAGSFSCEHLTELEIFEK